MSLVFKTRLFAEDKKKKSFKQKAKDFGNKVGKLPSKGAHKLFDLAEGKKLVQVNLR